MSTYEQLPLLRGIRLEYASEKDRHSVDWNGKPHISNKLLPKS